MNYTDSQLKQALAKMLPDSIQWRDDWIVPMLQNIENGRFPIYDTELLHLCWLVEETLTEAERMLYGEISWQLCTGKFLDFSGVYYAGELPEMDYKQLFPISHATWQQRTTALANVKGVEIV